MTTNKQINNCTLFVADCVNPRLAVKALEASCKHIDFKEVILFSHEKPFNFNEEYKFIQISKLNNLDDYCKFMIYQLPNFITTEFAFSVHKDGFITSPELWDDNFLSYDYIGAPWKQNAHFINNDRRVGNGGVSIRSKKLMDFIQKLPCGGHEDTDICIHHRDLLDKNGFTFAPLDLASKFSIEIICDDLEHTVENTFAFHGNHSTKHAEQIKKLSLNFYRDDLIKMDTDTLKDWVNNEAGSQIPSYFHCNTDGNLQLQQIPDEYSKFLTYIKEYPIKSYLELGVGNGGSFLINSIFLQRSASTMHCVDSIAYKDTHVKQTPEKIQLKVNILQEMFPEKDVKFINSTTNDFFANNKLTYDCIFIDADHTYEGVKTDYKNALKIINPSGIIIFHDVGNMGPGVGVGRLWEEIKHNYKYEEYKYKPEGDNYYNCGIGIIIM